MNEAPEDAPDADQAWLTELGRRTRRRRRDLSLTQEQVAVTAGVSTNTLIGLENGRHAPNVLTLRRIAEALQVTLPDLLP